MWKNRLMIAFGAAFFGLVFVLGIIMWRSAHNCHLGQIYLDDGKYVDAISFFDRSIHWYTPFNPYVEKSAQKLWKIANVAEKEGNVQLALIALQTIQQGFSAARSFYSPGKEWIERADWAINRIAAIKIKGYKDGEPDIFWSIMVETGLLGWIGSVICFLLKAVGSGKKPRLSIRPAVMWAGVFVFFYALWILGMTRA